MKFWITNNDGRNHIVSVALNKQVAEEFQKKGHNYWLLEDGKIIAFPEQREILVSENSWAGLSNLNNYDVLEIFPNGLVNRCYDDSSSDNVFYITNKCNSNCIMCPTPERDRRWQERRSARQLIHYAEYIPNDAEHFTITGGEPFMIGREIFDFLAYLKNTMINTEFLILTNGRIFSVVEYSIRLKNTVPNHTLIGIPLHAATSSLHDHITQVPGSFIQTVQGITNLLKQGLRIEIRIVVTKLNVMDLKDLAAFIAENFTGIDHVCIMAMEMTGNACVNKELVWISYREQFSYVKQAVDVLAKHGVDVTLYNFPLCTVGSAYWMLCRRSISEPKVRYLEKCGKCRVKHLCGGAFAGTIRLEEDEIEPII